MALSILAIFFIVMVVLSIVAVTLMFVFANKQTYTGTICFVIAALLAAFVTFLHATAVPSNLVTKIILAWAMGIPLIIGLLLKFVAKKHTTVANILVLITLVAGMLGMFFF